MYVPCGIHRIQGYGSNFANGVDIQLPKIVPKGKLFCLLKIGLHCPQGLVKGAILCCRNPHFYFRHGESTSTACQLTSPASQKSKDLNKVPLLLQDLDFF